VPIGKDIHRVLSKKWKPREEKKNIPVSEPAKINQSEKNINSWAKPQNVHITVAPPRRVSKNEGMPAVNGKSGEEVVKANVHKPRRKEKRVKAGEAAIKQKATTDGKSSSSKKTTSPRSRTPKSS